MLRIHDILGWIRIRGSMPRINGSGSGSCYFRHWPSRCQQKTNFFNTIFSAHYFFTVHLHHISKIKSQKESQNSRNQGFSYYFCMMIEGSGSGSLPLTSGSGWAKTRGSGGSGSATLILGNLHGRVSIKYSSVGMFTFARMKMTVLWRYLPQGWTGIEAGLSTTTTSSSYYIQ